MKSYYIIICCILFSCNWNQKKYKKYAQKTIVEWTGKQITLPRDSDTYIFDKKVTCDSILDKKVKILVYTDSVGCTACKLNLYDWKLRIDSLDDNPDLSFIFFVHAQHTNQFSNRLRGEAFNYPIFFDEKNIIEKLNHFPKDYRLQTFLLDSNNHVVLIGNPLGNESMWNLYKEEIKKLTKTKISNDET